MVEQTRVGTGSKQDESTSPFLHVLRNRANIADTVTAVTYGLAWGVANELYMSGMSWKEFAKTRAVMTGVNLTTGRPYGMYLDWLQQRCGLGKQSPFGYRVAVGMVAAMTFYAPVYVGAIMLSGGSLDEAKHATIGLALATPLITPTYRWWMERMRSAFNADTPHSKELTQEFTATTSRTTGDT